jgi:hypothetical protein
MALCYECQSQQGTGTLDSIKRATFDSTGAKECECGACCRLLIAVMQVLELTASYALHTGTTTTGAISPTANSEDTIRDTGFSPFFSYINPITI